MGRNYYTLSKKRELKASEKSLQFKFKINNNVSPLYSQIIWTLAASIIIAYGLDYTRLSYLKDYFLWFPEFNYLLLLTPLLFALAPYLINNILNRDSFNEIKNNKVLKFALFLSLMWFVLVFGVGGYNSYNPIHLGLGLKFYFVAACKWVYVGSLVANIFAALYHYLKQKKWFNKLTTRFGKKTNA